MKWTTGRIVLAALLAAQPVGIVLLLVYFMPKWTRDDKGKEG